MDMDSGARGKKLSHFIKMTSLSAVKSEKVPKVEACTGYCFSIAPPLLDKERQ